MKNILSGLNKSKIKITCFYGLLALPITLYLLPLLLSGNKIAPGDADYQFQLAEAFRRTVLQYHQFPWWNPWVAGGTPLYANAQFGLVSIQSPFILMFGSVMGFKLAIVGYYLIGFFGFRQVFIRVFNTPALRATLLAYIWSFGTFLSYRVAGGHFTFLMIQFFPWIFYLYQRRRIGKNWLYLALTLALMLLSAPHYMTILSFLVLGLFFFAELLHVKIIGHSLDVKLSLDFKDIRLLSKVMVVALVLSAYRLYYAFSYLSDYPRNQLIYKETSTGVLLGLRSIAWPFNQVNNAPVLPKWSWLETSAYIGVLTCVVFLIVLSVSMVAKRKKSKSSIAKQFTYPIYILLFCVLLFFVLGLGEFSKFAPYFIFRRLPFFNSMRVAPRWYVWVSMMILFVVAAFKSKRYEKILIPLLAVSCVELFIISQPLIYQTYKFPVSHIRDNNAAFEEQKDWKTTLPRATYDKNLLEATQNNYGQIIADDPLIDTTIMPTLRCDVDDGCPLISQNARITFWSPNKIIIKRLSGGPIKLNINPGKGWLVNGKYPFRTLKTVDPSQEFIISEPADDITVQYAPKFSLGWLKNKLR